MLDIKDITNKYQIIYADPPWKYDFSPTSSRAITAYPTMEKDAICGLPVKDIAADDSLLLLWATFPKLSWALDVIDAWGFEYRTNAFTWIKQNKNGEGLFWGLGNYTRSNAEICLLGKRGKGVKTASHSVHSVITAPVSSHSKKPPIIRKHIEELFGETKRIELFARKPAQLFDADGFDGWDVWGNEVKSDITL